MNSSTVLTLRGGCNEFNHNYNLNDRHGNPLNFDVTSPGWPAGERLLYQHGVNGADGAAAVRQRQEVGKGWRRRRLVSLRQRPAADDRAGPGFPGAGRDITDRITANVSDNLYLNKNAFTTTPVNRFADTPRILPGIYSPWRNNVDLGIRKNVRTGGGTSASINIEVLNMFNIVQWAAMASSQFGNSAFGQINNQANNMRMVQFTLRFQF